MVGGETELDRTVIDEMGEALVHLLRNAADHGLESKAQRLLAGKPETGSLRLHAYASGQHVMIEVSDDGRGIDVERVRAKAVERGLASEAAAAKWTDEEVYQMLFASGFSTAEQVSDIWPRCRHGCCENESRETGWQRICPLKARCRYHCDRTIAADAVHFTSAAGACR